MNNPIEQDVQQVSTILSLTALSGICSVCVQADKINGWLYPDEGAALFSLAMTGPGSGAIVEIGSFEGRSTIWLAKGSLAGKRGIVHSIDPHCGSSEHQPGGTHENSFTQGNSSYNQFIENIAKAGVHNHVKACVDFSFNVVKNWTEPIRLLFIDGAHEYEAVKQDFLDWSPFLQLGGIIAFHDFCDSFDGPRKVVQEYIQNNSSFKIIALIDSLVIAMRIS